MNRIQKQNQTVQKLTYTGILAALAFVIMLWEIPLWFAPPFYKIDFSEVPVLLGGLLFGPACGISVEALKIVLHLIFKGTSTAYVGELANFIIGCCFVVPASIVFKVHVHKKNAAVAAVIGCIIGIVCMAAGGALINYFVLIPAYSTMYGLPLEKIIEMGHAANHAITDLKALILLAVVPFNLLKGILSAGVGLLLYRTLKNAVRV